MLIMFPGQGTQKIGMGKNLYDTYKIAKDVFDEVDDSLSFKLSNLIFDGEEQDLKNTQNAQAAIMTVCIASLKVQEKEFGFDISKCKYMAGHSLGEYTALCASEVLTLNDTAKILFARGKTMAKAFPLGGAMAAIIGYNISDIEKHIKNIDESEKNSVQIANDNSFDQVVISGHEKAVKYVMDECLLGGARRAIMLDVSGPFHSRLMCPAVECLSEMLENVKFSTPKFSIISNVTAKPENSGFEKLLLQQLVSGVKWREIILFANHDAGINDFVEFGPGKVLTGLVKKIIKDINVTNFEV